MITKEQAALRALAFLSEHQAGTIATAALDGTPFSSTVYFGYLPDFTIFFTTSHHTAKFRNLAVNPKASFSVGTGPEFRELIIHGTVRRIEGTNEQDQALASIKSRVTSPLDTWPIHAIKKLEEGGTALFRVTPTEVLYLDLEGKDQKESASKYFYQLFP